MENVKMGMNQTIAVNVQLDTLTRMAYVVIHI